MKRSRMFALTGVLALVLSPALGGSVENNLPAALEAQRSLAAERPTDSRVHNDLANLLTLAGALREAEAVYLRAIELAPDYVEAHFNLGLLRQQMQNHDSALETYGQALAIDPHHAWSHYQAGTIHDQLGQRQEALDAYGKAFVLDPEILSPETNPHIIENELVIEALLRARRTRESGLKTPRAYDEPARIAELLLPKPHFEDDGLLEPPAPAADAAGTDRLSVGDGDTSESQRAMTAAGAEEPKVPSTTRTLTSKDLRGSGNGSSQPGVAVSTDSSRQRRPSSGAPVPGRPSLTQPQQRGRGVGAQPGVRSTGSLEWRLGPSEPEEVMALASSS